MHDARFTQLDAIAWRKSSQSTAHGEDCVEVAALSHQLVGVRDSKDPEGSRLSLTPADWQALTHRTKII
ncbi:DUF397 domain-containing protein [Actinomadura oligospora]|uniref:DUF397 domain-containing protein n=1 Tax=Actinomadura oligospora TaxID=111804 RepID=UPI0004BA23FC|nr:DUF397 domain-containing protein [Actinomadura oligospora]